MTDRNTPTKNPVMRLGALSLLVVALAGCTLGPDYKRPASSLGGKFIGAGSSAVDATPTRADITQFWRGFNDAALDGLIERALAANNDVRLAQARLQEVRFNQGEADAAARPGLAIDGGVTRSVTPITQRPGVSRSDRTGTVYDAGFIANWELDLFGRYRRGSEAAAALVDASQAGLHAAHTSVAAEVARNYLELRGLQQRLRIAEAGLVNQRDAFRISDARFEAGRGTRLDRERAAALVANTAAVVPLLQNGIERTVFRIATLVARPPAEVLAQLSAPAALPGLPVTDLARLPLGTPEQWLQRRPDLIAAERQLAAATATIGVAKTELFPRLSLTGLLGLNSASFSNLGRSESGVYSLGVGLNWTPFDLGAIRARIGATEARAQQSLVNYEQAVALALEETEGSLSSYSRSAQRAERQAVAVGHSREAARLARERYSAGVSDLSVVLDAERELLSSQDALMQSQTTTATALVGVYRALGGGWDAASVGPNGVVLSQGLGAKAGN
ncbi:MAG: TolC family protein [Pseudomonadota bacterium]